MYATIQVLKKDICNYPLVLKNDVCNYPGAEERYMQLSTGAEERYMQKSRFWRNIYATIQLPKKDICKLSRCWRKIYATIPSAEEDLCNYLGTKESYRQLSRCCRKIYATIQVLKKDICNYPGAEERYMQLFKWWCRLPSISFMYLKSPLYMYLTRVLKLEVGYNMQRFQGFFKVHSCRAKTRSFLALRTVATKVYKNLLVTGLGGEDVQNFYSIYIYIIGVQIYL
jgi:hypothetical protein